MATRHVKCTCTNCAAIFRMAQSNIDRGMRRGGLVCPICVAEAVVGDVEFTPAQRKQLEEICAKIAEEAVRPYNEAELLRRAEMREERAHLAKKRGLVHTG
jgi:hypothetical protein